MENASGLIPVVERAAASVGGATKLAEILGISRPALYQWKKVPAERAIAIEHATGGKVTRHDLRPDLYPDEPSRTASPPLPTEGAAA